MVDKVYIVWCKLNKNTYKFDLGIFTSEVMAKQQELEARTFIHKPYKIWVTEYKLSNV